MNDNVLIAALRAGGFMVEYQQGERLQVTGDIEDFLPLALHSAPPDAPAELLDVRGKLDDVIEWCTNDLNALASMQSEEEHERKLAVYQWLRGIVAAALEGRPSP